LTLRPAPKQPGKVSTGDEGRDLGFITLTAAAEIAKRQGAELDIDGPTREVWDAAV
jgi:hypothetical protein